QELTDWTHRQAPIDNLLKLFPVVRDVSAGPAHGKRWTNDRRKSDLFENLDGAFTAMCRAAGWHSQPNPLHGMFERFAILGLINRLWRRTDQLDLIFFERPPLGQSHRRIQRGLPSHGRKQ